MPAPAKPDLAWTYAAGKPIKAAAAIAGGRVFVGDDEGIVHAVDFFTGKELWKFKTDASIEATPLVLDGVVYIGSSDANVYAIEAATGKQKWKYETGDKVLGGANYAKTVIAFDPKSGEVKWKYRDRNFPYYSSAALTADRVIIGGRDKRLHCINRATGEGVWTFQSRGQVDSSPVICRDAIIVGSEDGRLYCVNLADGKERWAYDIGGAV